AVMRVADLRARLDALYRQYDHRFVDPDPLQFVRAQTSDPDREVVGLIAAVLAYGNVKQIKRSIARVVGLLGERPAEAVDRLDPSEAQRALGRFKHRFNDARDVACLLYFARQMRAEAGSIEAFFLRGQPPGAIEMEQALASFSERALALDHGGLYRGRRLP